MIVNTTHGPVDEKDLEKQTPRRGVVEYYFKGVLVHRSADLQLTGVKSLGVAKTF